MSNVSMRLGLAALVVAGLAGCGNSPPVRYHALSGPSAGNGSGGAHLLVELLPIAIPERLNRAEMVLTRENGRLDVRDGDRWAAPLSDEIRQTVADALWRNLRAAEIYQAPVANSAGGLPQYRLALRLERFEAAPGRAANVDGSWTLRRLPQGQSSTCRVSIAIPLPGQTAEDASAALAEGTGRVAQAVADSMERLERGAGACAP